jgi:hypothetical protein
VGEGKGRDFARFAQDEVAGIACGGWVTEDVELTVFKIDDPIVCNTRLGIELIFDFAVLFGGGVGNLDK